MEFPQLLEMSQLDLVLLRHEVINSTDPSDQRFRKEIDQLLLPGPPDDTRQEGCDESH